jgi:GTPase SAR1 family protein
MNEAEDAKEGGKEDSKHAKVERTMVVGNKIDLLDEKRLVSSEEGRQLAKSLGQTVKFTETRAKEGTGVDEAIHEVVRMI